MAEMNNQVEATVVEVIETKEKWYKNLGNKVKNVKPSDALKVFGAAAAVGGTLFLGYKFFGGNPADIVEDVIDVVEE